jgi:hypothetical protein
MIATLAPHRHSSDGVMWSACTDLVDINGPVRVCAFFQARVK